MALYDNKYWLLSHIRNSFISTDDTGMCELVMVGESKDLKQHLGNMESYREPEDSEDEEDDFESYDLHMDMDFGIRERSNTAVQLERLARKKAAKIRHIKWETNDSNVDVDDLFVKKDISQKVEPTKQKSLLSLLLESYSDMPKNPFINFAKFDGSGIVNIATKSYKIYLTMLPSQQRNYPMHVCCIATARIQELIGLILLKCSTTYGVSSLKPVTHYGLYITEEDGEVDRDFPCLDPKEPISKFEFNCLGLVEHKDSCKSVSFPEDIQHEIPIEENTFWLNRTRTVSEKSKADEIRQMENDMQAVEDHNKLMQAPLYKSFQVFMVSKVKPRIEVNLGISGERIEIDPVSQKSSKFITFKKKAVSHPTDTIAWCEVADVKSNRTSFRLVYTSGFGTNFNQIDTGPSATTSSSSPILNSSSSFKHYDFECDNSVAQDIVQKINLILELKSNVSREEYIAAKERKQKRKSFNLVK